MNLDIMKIKESLRNTQKSESTLIKSNDSSIETGQIWSVKNKNKNINTYLFCITEVLDENKINVNAVFRWTELAGPDDLKLPANFIGSRAVYSFKISATIAKNELDHCIGKLAEESLTYITNAKNDLEQNLNRPPFNWGKGYLDEYDVRYKYHENIIEDIETMQSTLLSEIFEDKTITNNTLLTIAFPIQENAIAADSKTDTQDKTYSIEGYDGVTLVVSEVDNSSLCNFNVYDEKGISAALAGATIYGSDGKEICKITKNCAEFTKGKILKGFFIHDKNDKPIIIIEEK